MKVRIQAWRCQGLFTRNQAPLRTCDQCGMADVMRTVGVSPDRRSLPRGTDQLAGVFSSDLARANIAFGGTAIPILVDWQLREYDHAGLTGSPAANPPTHRAEHVFAWQPGWEYTAA
jgi:hypothetical protein